MKIGKLWKLTGNLKKKTWNYEKEENLKKFWKKTNLLRFSIFLKQF